MTRSKSGEKPKRIIDTKEKEDAAKSKIGGFFSSMFKSKPKPKPTSPPPPEDLSPETRAISNVEFKFDDTGKLSKEDLKQIGQQAKLDSHKQSSAGATGESNGKPTQHEETGDDTNLKKDLIHTVLNAVQDNWLNQAPKPTLDKAAALQVPDSDPELENSERSTSEADYMKKKMKAQKKEQITSDDEGAQLWRQQESADAGDLPYVETTLPQEKTGSVTITPSKMRISQVQLTSTERPRTSGPIKPGTLSQYVKTKEESSKEPLTVKLPRQESKTKLKGKVSAGGSGQSWDNFSAAGVTQKQRVAQPPRSIPLQSKTDEGRTWVDCESLPEKKKQVKRYSSGGSESVVKSPVSDAGSSRSGGLQVNINQSQLSKQSN